MTPTKHTNGWSKYEELVLFRLDQQDTVLKELTKSVQSLKTSMALTKLKLGLIGFVSGTIGSALVYAFAGKAFHP